MADPRFYDNRGPFTLAEICSTAGAALPQDVDGKSHILDVASLTGAGPEHLTFFSGAGETIRAQLAQSNAGFCFVPTKASKPLQTRVGMSTIAVSSVQHAFAAAARLFYPESGLVVWSQQMAVDPSAMIGANVTLGLGVVIGSGAEIGDGTRIGPNSVIGRGVAIGRN